MRLSESPLVFDGAIIVTFKAVKPDYRVFKREKYEKNNL